MSLPANDSPLWVLLRSGVLLTGLLLFYRQGLEAADVKTMLLCIFADGTINAVVKAKEKT